jgi:hypothetical protein
MYEKKGGGILNISPFTVLFCHIFPHQLKYKSSPLLHGVSLSTSLYVMGNNHQSLNITCFIIYVLIYNWGDGSTS